MSNPVNITIPIKVTDWEYDTHGEYMKFHKRKDPVGNVTPARIKDISKRAHKLQNRLLRHDWSKKFEV